MHRRDHLRRTLFFFTLLLPSLASGGEWHRERGLVCSDCHTMHNSQGGASMRYDDPPATPASASTSVEKLLRAETTTAVCLACHDGSRPAANGPNVMQAANVERPGGGFPTELSDPLQQAHSLSTVPVMPPGGDVAVAMTCVTCHDPHGTGGYRNLRVNPSGQAGTNRPADPPSVSQLVTANGTNPDQVYVRSNVRYLSGMSQWCLDCHNNLASDHSSGAESVAHQWDRSLWQASLAEPPVTDFIHWSDSIITNRVPVQNLTPDTTPTPGTGDQVFCLSCHKAHGSTHDAALVYADGETLSSTCQQCHNQ